MKENNLWRMGLGLLMAAMLLTPGNCPAQPQSPGSHYRLDWEKLAKELDLTSEKAGQFQAIGAKYSQTRESLVEKLQKNETDLEKAVAGPNIDEVKIRELVPMVIADHNQLFESLKMQRQEEMTLLTPVQQAKYLLALKKWHEENCGPAKTAK